jgi:cation diffusion facilitator CzcD-associated flavoprotein CzcO
MTKSTERFDAIIIGAGFSGVYMLHKLKKLGLRCRLLEAGDGVGGAWYWNRYPGARCDSESYFYCYFFSDEILQEWTWSEKFPGQPEIEKYLNYVTDKLGLRGDMKFNSKVKAATYDEKANSWTVETAAGDKVETHYLVTAIGGLAATATNLPAIPGLEDFKGEWHHTGHWPKEGVDFRGKRVGVIGNGSTGVQAIPVIAETAGHLTVFQRTPGYVMPAKNAPLSAEETAEIKRNYPEIRQRAYTHRGGQPYTPPTRDFTDFTPEEARQKQEEYWERGGLRVVQLFKDVYTNPAANEFTRQFFAEKVREIVKDSETAAILEPKGYPMGAKRVILDTHYYETFNRPNVSLVDAKKNPIETFTPTGLRAGGKDYALDVFVFATGYDAVTGPFKAIDFRGRGGVKLADRLADGPRAYLGMSFARFPNLFTVNGPCNPGLTTNVPVAIEHDVEWIADCIEYLEKNKIKTIEATEAAEDDWTEGTQKFVEGSIFHQASSWFFGTNVPGKPKRFLMWLGGLTDFREKCSDIAKNNYEGFTLTR